MGSSKNPSVCHTIGGEELPFGVLPELKESTYSEATDVSDAFTSFINGPPEPDRPVDAGPSYPRTRPVIPCTTPTMSPSD